MVKTVTGRSCWLRVAGTLLRSGAYAFVHWVLIELGKGIALEAIERSRGFTTAPNVVVQTFLYLWYRE